MSYVKTNWVNGPNTATPITAANLNKLETQYDAVAADIADGSSPIGTQLIATFGLYAPAPTGIVATDSANLQPLLLEAQSSRGTLFLQEGTYRVDELTTAALAEMPKIVGRGEKNTFLEGTTAGATLTFLGGGGFSGGYLSDCTITGIGVGLELQGCIGVNWDRLGFDGPDTGILFHNKLQDQFTEMCSGEAHFANSVKTAVEYRKTAGADSFHGSGLTGQSTINQPPGATAPSVLIGSGAFVYNAPLSATIWVYEETQPIIRNDALGPIVFYGSLRVELLWGNGNPGVMSATLVDPASFAEINYLGRVSSLGGTKGGFVLGPIRFAERVEIAGAPGEYTLFGIDQTLATPEAPYTPTLSGVTLGNGSMSAYFRKLGTQVTGSVHITLGSTSAVDGYIQIGLPYPSVGGSGRRFLADGYLLDNEAPAFIDVWVFQEGVSAFGINYRDSSGAAVKRGFSSGSAPFLWSAQDQIMVSFAYEAA